MDLDYTEKMQGYIDSLEKEKSKILVFQRELPLCLELVSQAIESCKQQLSGTSTTEYNVNGQSECSEQTTSTEGPTPVLEQFIPMKRADDDVDADEELEHDEEEHEHHSYKQQQQQQQINDTKKKSDWLRSAQLWNQTPDPLPKQDAQPPRKVVSVVEVKRNNGAFQPFHREKSSVPKSSNQSSDKSKNLPAPVAATSSTAEPAATVSGSSGGKKEEKGQNSRKQRRCWSPELHRRFLQALQQLGGSHAATPKQIRELMKVDSLTNDEVKSHLQKFRLHTRRPSPTIQNNNPQPPQIVVVGGIWVPSQEYTAMATTDATKANSASGIYTPIATTPQPTSVPKSAPLKTSQNPPKSVSEGRSSHGTGGGVRSHSPSASSSSHTTTASPMY